MASLQDLLGGNSSFTDMTTREKLYFKQLLEEEMIRRRESSKVEQIREIVPIEDWIDSTYFIGPDADKIYPYWKDFIVNIFRSDRKPEESINNVIISGSIGTGKSCLQEDTRVPTTLGLIKLKDLWKMFHFEGKRFKVLSEEGIRDCVDVYDNGVADTVIIKFKSGRVVEGTPNHKFRLVRDGKVSWVPFSDISIGDHTIMTRGTYPESSLELSDYDAYTLGYIMGDGWYEKRVHKDGSIVYGSIGVMFQKENSVTCDMICKSFRKWFGDKVVDKPLRVSTVSSNGNTMITLRGQNTKLATWLVNSGAGSGSSDKGVPEFIFRCDRHTQAYFLRGLFDSDGACEKDGYSYVTLKSKRGIYEVGNILSTFGIDFTIRDSDSYFNNKYCGKVYTISIRGTKSYLLFNKFIGFSIGYKKKRLENKISKCKSTHNINDRIIVPFAAEELRRIDSIISLGNGSKATRYTQFRRQDNYTLKALNNLYNYSHTFINQSDYLTYVCDRYDSIYFDEVVDISYGRSHTYDLTIDKTHSYCFNGFISHNTCAELIMMRKMYELSCYKNVNALYHLMSKTNIMFLYFSVSQKQAERTGFGEFKSFVDNSPYFRDNFHRKERVNSLLLFPEGITFAYGSNASDSIGMSVICAMLDEANFVSGDGSNSSGNTEKALDMFAGIVNRSNSRFILDGGINHSLNILVSSSTQENSATAKQMEMSRDDPHTLMASPSQWEVKPDKFSKKFFYVMKGTNFLEPTIVRSVDDVNSYRLSEGLPRDTTNRDGEDSFESIEGSIQRLPNHMQTSFLKVPVDLKAGFEANIIRSLQDLGGVSTGVTGKLFSSPVVYDGCVDKSLHHPFIQPEIVVSTGDNVMIQDYLRSDFHFNNLDKPRFIHIDQSFRTDSTGIACGYVSDIKEEDGVPKAIFTVDFLLRINPPKPPRKIAIYKIRNFIIYLNVVLGVKIGKITYDIFNSEESRQILQEKGYNVGYLSVDRSDKPYLDLVELMYEGRVRFYDYPILRYELFNLIHYRDRHKVDHPKTVTGSYSYNGKGAGVGSKDVADALCGMISSILKEPLAKTAKVNSTIHDFMVANTDYGDLVEPTKVSVEELINRDLDRMIEDYEDGNGYDYSVIGYDKDNW